MDKMNAITFSRTGHLLGVVTRTSQPEKTASTADIAQGGFVLRKSDLTNILLEIPEDEIQVALVDYDTRVLYRPHLFVLQDGNPEQKAVPPDGSISLDGDQITATLPNSVSSSTDVWCQISGGNLIEPIVRAVTIPGTENAPVDNGTEDLNLGVGDYKVAMFAPGYALALFMETVT